MTASSRTSQMVKATAFATGAGASALLSANPLSAGLNGRDSASGTLQVDRPLAMRSLRQPARLCYSHDPPCDGHALSLSFIGGYSRPFTGEISVKPDSLMPVSSELQTLIRSPSCPQNCQSRADLAQHGELGNGSPSGWCPLGKLARLLKKFEYGSALASAKLDAGSNELVRAVAADFETAERRSGLQKALRQRFADAEPVDCVKRSLANLREVSSILDAKAPGDAAALKLGR